MRRMRTLDIVAGVVVLLGITVWGIVSSVRTNAAIWSDPAKTYFEKSSTISDCGIGHCPVLPATSATYCPDGYSGNPCTQSYAPTSRSVTNTAGSVKTTYWCQNGATPKLADGKNWCNSINYSNAINKKIDGMTKTIAESECKNTYSGYFNKVTKICYYTYANSRSYCDTGFISNGVCKVTVTEWSCSGGPPWSQTKPSTCKRTADTLTGYRDSVGDANYAVYGIIRSGDTTNASFSQSQYFMGLYGGKPAALVKVLRDYYDGTHTNITAVGGKDTHKAYAKSGAAFVVNTMLGRPQGSSRDIAENDWTTLRSVLEYLDSKKLIDWNALISGDNKQKNTHAVKVGSVFDIEQSNDSVKDRKGIVIKDGSGKVLYSLMYACANPYGDSQGIAPFDLYPSLSLSPDTIAESGSAVSVSPTVDNKEKGSSYQTGWIVSRFVLKNGNQPKQGSDGTPQNPTQYFIGSTQVGAGNQDFAQGINKIPSFMNDLPQTNPGDRVCYALSLAPFSNMASGWRHSNPVCVAIGKKPKVQIWGGDVRAGRAMIGVTAPVSKADIMTSTSVKGSSTYGSWTEYGASATGTIIGFGTGSAFAGSNGLQDADVCAWSLLSFSNVPAGPQVCSGTTQIGRYTDNRIIPDVASSFGVGQGVPTVSGAVSVSNLAGVNKAVADIDITGGSLAKGRWVVIYAPDRTVRISGDITYANGPFTVLEDIPQLVIIARNIDINASVTQIDSWLIAKPLENGSQGIINTCREKGTTDGLTVSDCKNLLTVNGPVMANKLYLRRTAGSGSAPTTGEPAERFNLRPDAYLWAYTRANTTLRANTVYVRELPPRL